MADCHAIAEVCPLRVGLPPPDELLLDCAIFLGELKVGGEFLGAIEDVITTHKIKCALVGSFLVRAALDCIIVVPVLLRVIKHLLFGV